MTPWPSRIPSSPPRRAGLSSRTRGDRWTLRAAAELKTPPVRSGTPPVAAGGLRGPWASARARPRPSDARSNAAGALAPNLLDTAAVSRDDETRPERKRRPAMTDPERDHLLRRLAEC